MTEEKNEKLISVIVPVFNSGATLQQTLDSLRIQTLDKKLFEIIIVDDKSTDLRTISMVEELEQDENLDGIELRVIWHKENKWLAEVRNTGIKNARAEFICFLDSDDLIDPDYLKKSYLCLISHPRAGWAYPNIMKFGTANLLMKTLHYNARNLFMYNYCGTASLYRKKACLDTGWQRKVEISKGVYWFEDWDYLVRMASKGWYGVPMQDSKFWYRQNIKSLANRNHWNLLLTSYWQYRKNWFRFFSIFRSQKNNKLDMKARDKNFSLIETINDWLKGVATKFFGREMRRLPLKAVLFGIFFPKKFQELIKAKDDVLTPNEYCLQVNRKILEKDIVSEDFVAPEISPRKKKKVIFAHYWWIMGGADKILLDWVKAFREKEPDSELINVVSVSHLEKWLYLKEEFKKYVDEQISLEKISTNPYSGTKAAWELVKIERPDVIYIMSNPAFYAITPFIKKYFPEIKIVDLLHNEEYDGNTGWYGMSDDYKEFLDRRVVTSEHWKKILIERYGEKTEKISVAYNSVDLKDLDPEKKIKNKEKFVVGFIGRFHFQKNPRVFLKLAELMADDDRFEFLMAGDGPDGEDDYKEVMDALKNSKGKMQLKYDGRGINVVNFYKKIDLAIFPSRYEGYPMVGIECAAMNIPIIATNIVGFREQIEMGKFGILYDPTEDIEDAQKIRDIILENLEKWEEIGANGRNFVEKLHDYEKNKTIYTKIVEDLIEKK